MFCVECGKERPIFKEGVCISCFLKSHRFTQGPKAINLLICSHCSLFKFKNTWTSELFSELIRKIIKNNFQISRELSKVDISTKCNEINEGMSCKVYISGFLDDTEVIEEHDMLVRLKKTVCDVCSKRFGGYHEAIVQIRADKRDLTKKELKDIIIFVETLVEDLKAKGNRGLFITDIGDEHGRLDFYISERGPSLIIAKKIQELYGGSIKKSSKNIGMKDGRQIYRMTYLIRLPSIKKGDFIKHNNFFFNINSIHGNKVKMTNLSNWEETIANLQTIQKDSILGGEGLIKEMILISQTKDELQLMDSDTYKIQVIKKPKQKTFKSEKIKILRTKKQILLIPNNS